MSDKFYFQTKIDYQSNTVLGCKQQTLSTLFALISHRRPRLKQNQKHQPLLRMVGVFGLLTVLTLPLLRLFAGQSAMNRTPCWRRDCKVCLNQGR